jgi:pimeloyl-ACP methyl ester carboxylesterase
MKTFSSFDGTEIAYLDEGEGRPVVLVHGFSVSGPTNFGPWPALEPYLDAIAAALAEASPDLPALHFPRPEAPMDEGLIAALVASGRRVVAPDMRGHGASGKPLDAVAYRDRAMARDVLALLDHLGLERVDVLGYSMGSGVVAQLASLAPERVTSIVLGGIGSWIVTGEPFLTPPELGSPYDSVEAFTEEAARSLEGEPAGFGASYVPLVRAAGMDARVAASIMREQIRDTVEPGDLRRLEVPVLVLNGDADFVAQFQQAGLAQYFADVRYGTCGGDHLGAVFDRDFQQTVVDFLR